MGGVVQAVSNVVGAATDVLTGKPMRSLSQDTGGLLGKALNFVGNTITNIVKNPLPVIETIALTALGVPPVVASAAVSAMNGGKIEDIAKAAVSSYVGGQAGSAAGTAATEAGASTTLAKVASSAAGASTSTVISAVASGKSLGDALKDGLSSAVVAGGTTGAIEYSKEALAPPETGGGIKAVPGAGTTLAGDQTKVSGLGLTDKVPATMDSMGGASGLIVDPNVILPPSLAKSPYVPPSTGKVAGTDTGGLQPAATSAADKLTPPSFDTSITGTTPETPYKEPTTVTAKPEPAISKTTEALARPVISGALSELFGLGPKVPGAPAAGGTSPVPTGGATTGTTVGLTGERGAGEIESKESGKARQNVWNEASLRLKDALGV